MSIKYDIESFRPKKQPKMFFKAELKAVLFVSAILILPGIALVYYGFNTSDFKELKGGLMFLATGTALILTLAIKGKEWIMEKISPYF